MKRLLVGAWKLVEMEQWDVDPVDDTEPAIIRFARGGQGDLRFAAIQAGIDWRFDEAISQIEFTLHGFDEGDEVMGRGRGRVDNDGLLRGRLWFHLGEESDFVARKL